MVAVLTVGLIAGQLRKRVELSLTHILGQTALDRMEVIVVDLNPEHGPFAGTDHPRVRYLPRPQYRYYYEAQSELTMQARTPLIAFIEDHSYASAQWADAVINTFDNPNVVAVSYTFTSASGAGYLSRSILMSEYGHWMAPHPGGAVSIASSTNVAYRRELLVRHIEGAKPVFESEFLVHRALQANGGEIHVAPEATVAHESWCTLWDACLANGANKRVLGARRVEHGNWGPVSRFLWAGGMVLLPGVATFRLGWVLRKRPQLWTTYLLALPVIAAIYGYAAYCEALGYLFGAGGSREEFLDRELAVRRDG